MRVYKICCSHSTQNVPKFAEQISTLPLVWKYRCPHIRFHYVCKLLQSAAQDVELRDIFLNLLSLRFANRCFGTNKFYFVLKSYICNTKITLTKTIKYIMKKSAMGKYWWDYRKGRWKCVQQSLIKLQTITLAET